PMTDTPADSFLGVSVRQWQERGFTSREALLDLSVALYGPDPTGESFARLVRAFNGSDLARRAIARDARAGVAEAREAAEILEHIDPALSLPYRPSSAEEYRQLRSFLDADPDAIFDDLKLTGFPYYVPGRTYAYDIHWVRSVLAQCEALLTA